AWLGLVLGNEGIAAGLVLGSRRIPRGLGLGLLALLHVLHRDAKLVDRHGRVLLRVAVLQALVDGADIQRFAALAGVTAKVVTERVAQFALLGCTVLGEGLASGQGQGRYGDRNQTQLHSVKPPVVTRSGRTAPIGMPRRSTAPSGQARITT